MLLTFLVGLSASLSIPIVDILATPTEWLLSYMIHVATFLSELSWAQSEIAVDVLFWIGYFVVLIGACLWMWKVTKYNLRQSSALVG